MATDHSTQKLYLIAIDGVRLSVPLSKEERAQYSTAVRQFSPSPRSLYLRGVSKRRRGLKKPLAALWAVTVNNRERKELAALLTRLEAWVGPLHLDLPEFEGSN